LGLGALDRRSGMSAALIVHSPAAKYLEMDPARARWASGSRAR
jgi:hypothetical protein